MSETAANYAAPRRRLMMPAPSGELPPEHGGHPRTYRAVVFDFTRDKVRVYASDTFDDPADAYNQAWHKSPIRPHDPEFDNTDVEIKILRSHIVDSLMAQWDTVKKARKLQS